MNEQELYANDTTLRAVARLALQVQERANLARDAVAGSHRLVSGGTAAPAVGALAAAERHLREALTLCQAAQIVARGRA